MATTEKTQITIIGLGLVGASIGLALHRYAERVVVVGHDKNSTTANRAKSLGAVDRTEWNLVNAIRGADRVVLALPAQEIQETLEYIKQDLKPGCLVLDTASIKAPVLAWAAAALPPEVSLVGGHPILISETQDIAAARADLFQGKLFCLTSDAHTNPEALHLATDLVEAIGAKPFYIDPAEHDGMVAAVEQLPMLLAGALARAAGESQSWKEMRKLAGSQFYATSYVIETSAGAAAADCLDNSTNTIRWIDNLIAELSQWRQRLAAGDAEGLTQAFEQARTVTEEWIRAQESGEWNERQAVEYPTAGSTLRRMFGFGGRDFRGLPGQAKDKKK